VTARIASLIPAPSPQTSLVLIVKVNQLEI